jgi:ubiquinone/menaquinone biosynthesis C-methylase UbiE
MSNYYPESKVELKGFIAKNYDALLNVATFGRYSVFIKSVIMLMEIGRDQKILDFGAGTGSNACLMLEHLSPEGELLGLDISEDMIAQFNKNCAGFPNARLVNKRIDRELEYEEYFDRVFISFVLHGFPQEARKVIIRNAFKALKKGGQFFILDYNEFSLKDMPFYIRAPFKWIECPYAFDFIKRDWRSILSRGGFDNFEEHLFFKGYVRLLKAEKVS